MVLVIVILVAWAVILGPGLVKRRARSGGDQSITHFHHQLRILEHSAPEPIVAPAYRLRAVDGNGTPMGISYPDSSAPPKLTVVGAKELPRPALAFLGEPAPAPETVLTSGSPAAGPPRADHDHEADHGLMVVGRHRSLRDEWVPAAATLIDPDGSHRGDGFARQQARRRRRDTLTVLAAVFAATLPVAAVTGATAVWALCRVGRCGAGRLCGTARTPPWHGRRARAQASLPRRERRPPTGPGRRSPDVHERPLRPPVEPAGRRPLTAH